jgi:hypothetical protein
MSLHSRYDPLREAERYIDAVGIDFDPFCVVVSEPGDSWLARALRTRYPDALLVVLRYDPVQFADTDSLWDAVWRPGYPENPEIFLFNIIPDEYLPLTVFLPWKPADSLWPAEAERVWQAIASLIRLQKDVMYTRSMFGKRWLSNMVRNFMLAGHAVSIDPVSAQVPVLLALSGPSLEAQFPFDDDQFFVCAVSSALSCLRFRGCRPDLCIATDGGYWALPLFRDLEDGVPVTFPLEAAIPADVLAEHPSVFLSYGSVLERDLFSMLGIVAVPALRNGTVAGTALQYLLARSSSRIYVSGLDLQNTASFSHARPHPSLENLDAKANRFVPASAELFFRNRESASLETYARWFSSHVASFGDRVFRLLPEGRPIHGFPTVDIRRSTTPVTPNAEKPAIHAQALPDIGERRERLSGYLDRCVDSVRECRNAKDTRLKKKLFAETLVGPAACAELLQLVSYTDYINALKAVRMDDSAGVKAVDRLCDEAQATLLRLCGKVATYA